MSSLAVFMILGGATAFAAVKKVGPNEIKANSIKTGKIVKEAVKAGKLAKNAVIENKIADGAVTTNKLADNAVTTGKIAKEAVTGEKLATNAVTATKIANDAVSNGKLQNASVNGPKVADRSLNADDVTQASGQETADFGSLAVGSCNYVLVSTGIPDITGYLLFASPGNAGGWPGDVIVDPYLSNIAGSLRIRVCNVGTSAADPPNTTFNWAVMEVA
jgi:polyhydroxyalkanoate synthesis regulator phasin